MSPPTRIWSRANIELVDVDRREYPTERHALEPIRDTYHYILMDCPPALDLLTLNGMVAADSVLVPIQCEFFALEGISQLVDTIDRIREIFQPNPALEGILLTMFDDRTNSRDRSPTISKNSSRTKFSRR